MSFDYKQFKEFADTYSKFEEEYALFLKSFMKIIALRALRATKKITPVDTGDLRNRWEISSIYKVGADLQVDLINPLEYASFVEDGHWQNDRWVPGRWVGGKFQYIKYNGYGPNVSTGMKLKAKWIPGVYMARISIAKIEADIPKRYNAEFKKFIAKFE